VVVIRFAILVVVHRIHAEQMILERVRTFLWRFVAHTSLAIIR
jgi:hypothetical protein